MNISSFLLKESLNVLLVMRVSGRLFAQFYIQKKAQHKAKEAKYAEQNGRLSLTGVTESQVIRGALGPRKLVFRGYGERCCRVTGT